MEDQKLRTLSPGERHTFIQIVDPPSGYAIEEKYCGIFDYQSLENGIGYSREEMSPRRVCLLDGDALEKAKSFFGISVQQDNDIHLVSWSPEDGLPYRLHTNRELILMRRKIKPLSVFYASIPKSNLFQEIPDYLFQPLVDSGALVERELCETISAPKSRLKGGRMVLYALKGEEWRIDAYILVRSTAEKIGWSESLMRMEGTLLGYLEWQNDAYIAKIADHRAPTYAAPRKGRWELLVAAGGH